MTRRESIKTRVQIDGTVRAWSNITVKHTRTHKGKSLTILTFPSLHVAATLTPEATRALADRLHDVADMQEDLLRRDSAHMRREHRGTRN